MALTIRQHKIAALKLARSVIIEPNIHFGTFGVCNALRSYNSKVPYSNHIRYTAIRELYAYIEKSLGRHSHLQNWLIAKKHVKQWIEHRDPRMVATRVAWIDWMIQCLEEDEANGK